MSDRLAVMHRGSLSRAMAPEEADLDTLGLLMTGQPAPGLGGV